MDIFKSIITLFRLEMERPLPYEWFHLISCLLVVAATVYLCVTHKRRTDAQIDRIVFWTAVIVTIMEVYKQLTFSFSIVDGSLHFDYLWYAFPWQFCSTPMYVGLLIGVFKKGIVRDALYAYLGTYSLFAGLCVMVYPVDVFIEFIGINVQTMFCHGSMIVIGIYLLYSGKIKFNLLTLGKALTVFFMAVMIADIMNEAAYYSGILKTDTFNMFFISPYCESTLPVYSYVHKIVPYPLNLFIYIGGFTAAAGAILAVSAGIWALAHGVVKVHIKKFRKI